MALYVVLALSALILGPWLVGFAVSVWIDASRPREVQTSVPPSADRPAMVQRLTEEWQQVGGHWVPSPENEEDRRAE